MVLLFKADVDQYREPVNAPLLSESGFSEMSAKKLQSMNVFRNLTWSPADISRSLFLSSQGHQVEVQSHGGHVTGVGTIHGNVDISAHGDSVGPQLHITHTPNILQHHVTYKQHIT